MIEKICEFCGERYTPKKNFKNQKNCSIKCSSKLWKKNNPEKEKEHQRKLREKRKNDPIRYEIWKKNGRERAKTPVKKYSHYKTNAKIRNILFELSFEQFLKFWKKDCFYCGSEIDTVGIDRKDNTQGYTEENSVPCCEMCNKMKMKYDYTKFITQCKLIAIQN